MRNRQSLTKYWEAGQPGIDWYDVASDEIQTVCARHKWGVSDFVDVLALTSPRVAVSRNVKLTLDYFGARQLRLMRNVAASVKHWERTREIRGLKTSAFSRALKGDVSAIVLDVHMAGILDVEQSTFKTLSGYRAASRRVRLFADHVGASCRDVQAALWTGYRLLGGLSVGSLPVQSVYDQWVSNGFTFSR